MIDIGRVIHTLSQSRRAAGAVLRAGGEAPLRAELFSAEQMEHHGATLAATHQLGTRRVRYQLLTRLAQNENVLVDACAQLTQSIKDERPITPAGEWLLDNFYLIEEQIRTARRHLPRHYSSELPALRSGPSAGLPRVYDIALEIISHGDGQVDPDSLSRFIAAYQNVIPLTVGELWAVPIMLRLALIENLRRVAARLAASGTGSNTAAYWADHMTRIVERDPKNLVLVIADMARSNPPTSTAFVAELARRLQGQSPAVALALTWVEQWLAESGLTIKQMVQSESQHQAADQVSIANSIGSLRFLAVMDWRKFVEAMSIADRVLAEDPAGVYARMDFATRDDYRHVLERIARRIRGSEIDVARKALELARLAAADDDADARRTHVGYYLVDRGLPTLERAVRAPAPAKDMLRHAGSGWRLALYLGAIALITAVPAVFLWAQAAAVVTHPGLLAFCVVLFVLCASELAVQLVNRMVSLIASPRTLPHMDFREGISPEAKALVVVPTLLASQTVVDQLLEALEIRFLANRDPHLHFGLLTDFVDAQESTLASDAPLLQQAKRGVEGLNAKHGEGRDDVFYLFHRPRRYNERERVWMGFERKRGKLGDLNALLRGDGAERFSCIVGRIDVLRDVRYVITLDSDTQLPRDAARAMVAAMAHPLNRPRYDRATRRVVEGYGILQPRVSASLAGSRRSLYARLQGGEVGLDPYTRTVSDVYQDLFGEGSFIGKGIYDVDAFEFALAGRFPDNRILSHDLLEGCYARSGLLSDTQLYEDDPSSYAADTRRRHRWVRGDWQIASWLFKRVPGTGRRSEPNVLSLLSQWKIFDNLRRSLVPAALTSLLCLAWTALSPAWFWTVAVVAIIALPALVAVLADLVAKAADTYLAEHIRTTLRSLVQRLAQVLFAIACLPFETYATLDAIVRTTLRTVFTRRHLLQWTPSGDLEHASIGTLAGAYRSMWAGPALAVTIAVLLIRDHPQALPLAAPILLLWIVSPWLAWWLSRPLPREQPRLEPAQRAFLRMVARRTWGFFEHVIGEADHWLPPDNVQENPDVVVAHRTSPTNIGMALLANLAAHDFGYLSTGRLLERTALTFATLQRMQRHRGHFFNWYDTRTLEPLHPRYVSTVDSGNLVGHLLTLRSGLASLGDEPILPARWFEGLADTVATFRAATTERAPPKLAGLEREIDRARSAASGSVAATRERIERVAVEIAHIAAQVPGTDEEATIWLVAMDRQCSDALAEFTLLAPWNALASAPERLSRALLPPGIPTLKQAAALATLLAPSIERALADQLPQQEREWLASLGTMAQAGSANAAQRLAAIDELVATIASLTSIDYDFLYDSQRYLMAIGYNVSESRCDTSFYDLLASEARLSTFVGIAQGLLPQESWFAMGRLLTHTAGEPILLSWSGSMFEYLMPLLVMPTYDNTLLDQTMRAAVKRQIRYGAQRGVPWGISECGYNVVDASLTYQYRAFGVPGLGLQRGLSEDVVIAPYAAALALMVAPPEACRNLQQLAAQGCLGHFGFYEAIDYTPSRMRRGESSAIVRSFMAHHQGMSLLSLAYLLLDQPMQRRFVSDPNLQSTLLLLQERVPKARALYSNNPALVDLRPTPDAPEAPVRTFKTPDLRVPAVQLLSNGRYHVMVTSAGGGSSRWKDIAVTRWREDVTCDPWGNFCYLRDVATGNVWSPSYLPARVVADAFEANFAESRVEFRRRDGDIETHTEIVVSPEDDVELRRLHITNRGRAAVALDVATYAEVVLTSAAADTLHPAFSNLFVQTEIVSARRAILCTRRPRSHSEHSPCLLHLMAVHGGTNGETSYETDRARFIGRGNSVADPQAMRKPRPLSGTQGSVLDPIVSIRQRINIAPQQTMIVDMVTGIGEDRAACLALVEKYQDRRLADRALEMAWTHSHVVLRQLNITEAEAQLYGRLTGSIIFANASLRADPGVIARNRRGQSSLWGYAISGDLPIVLLQIKDPDNIELVRQLVQAHAYWRLKGLVVDLVIWNEERGGYRQLLHDRIMGLIAAGVEANVIDRPGGIFLRAAEQISAEDRALLQSVARAIFTDSRGSLAEQVRRPVAADPTIPRLIPAQERSAESIAQPATARPALRMDNGLGGFSEDGREYVIITTQDRPTPAPWVNVIANPYFGCVISENGPVYTWSENAHEYRLSPWHNDPVTDASGEAFYIRDEESGRFWSPTPLPRCGVGEYTCRHGFGYSVFEHSEDGIATELTMFVAPAAAIKFSVLRIRNTSGRTRRLCATGYIEWVLGDLRPKTTMHVVTEIDPGSGAVLARNAYHPEFADNVAFFDVDDVTRTISGDRTEFIGRNGSLRDPAALWRARLSGKVGAGMDPCTAIQIPFTLTDGQSREIIFRLGVGRGPEDASRLVLQHRRPGTARDALEAVKAHWKQTLGAVQVTTPDPSIDLLANGWLLYQTLSCRIWGRSGYYQSGGAYGYRDQLQDTMALVHAAPHLVREQLLRCASRQFLEGDAQHWWHPPLGRGVRSRCSDDFLWLAMVTCHYVAATGDWDVLTEQAPFLDGRALGPEEESYYDLPVRSREHASLYQHCVRAVERALAFGDHGLPLMGSGDWNDGMNNVGIGGKGESVWLGFFLYDVLAKFGRVADRHGDSVFAQRCQDEARSLRANLERHAWDGGWYLRAFFDDGTPLGSARSTECNIDSVAQSWSVLSGAGSKERTVAAMLAVDQRLVKRDAGLVQLLDPPFDTSGMDPGYIRGYVPGVRENGGQYTHGAIWAAMAFAALRDSEHAWEIMRLINPINHGDSAKTIAVYRAEPYVVAADVYAVAPHTGRGGWSWYTGSAGWMYRLILEALLGVRREGDRLTFAPCLPRDWPSCEICYRYLETTYRIVVRQESGEDSTTRVWLDDVAQAGCAIALVDDRQAHVVDIRVEVEPVSQTASRETSARQPLLGADAQ